MNTPSRVAFGSTGLRTSRIGLGSSYGIGGRDIERAYDEGINFLFWGLRRTGTFAEGIRAVAKKNREDIVVGIQSYSRSAMLMRPWVERALRRAALDYVDLLTLGWWNAPPPARILDQALALRESGKVRHLMISCHHRPSFELLLRDPTFEGIMVRYSAAHPGAETEVFPHLAARPCGVLAFTATRWGTLLDPALAPEGERVPTASDCYRFAISNPHVSVSLAGPKDGEELEAALTALREGSLSEEDVAWMRRVGASVRANAKSGNFSMAVLDKLSGIFAPKPALTRA